MKIPADLVEKNSIKLLIIGIITVGAIIFDIFGQVKGAAIFAPLLFFLPIILAAYWYPQKGVLYAVGIGILQLILVSQFTYPDLAPLTYATATASFYVLVAVSVVVSALSGNLRLQEARYQAIFDDSQAGVVLVAEQAGTLVIEEVNKSAGASLGYLPKDLAGAHLISIWDDPSTFQKTMERLEKESSISDIKSSLLTRQGTSFPVLITAARLPEHHLVFTFMDITSIREAELRIKRRNNQLTIVNEVITITSNSENVYDLLEKSFEKIRKLLPVTSGAIYLLDADRQLLEAHYRSGEESILSSLPLNIQAETPPFNDIVRHGTALYTLYSSGGNESDLEQLSAIIPISCGSNVIGLLCLVSPRNEPFAEDNRVVLESIGKEIGCAVQKLQLSDNLAEANRKANLYLDILVHDINDANTRSFGYIDILTEMLNGKLKEYAITTRKGIEESIEIIRKVTLIRRIREKTTELAPVDLDAIVRTEMLRNRNVALFYEKTGILVMADDLLSEIFANLISNSVIFGGPFVTIWVQAKKSGETVTVSVADSGPGIPDPVKPKLFINSSKGTTRGNAKGLGLYIVKMLLDRYGGKIKVHDRVTNDPSQGVSMTFTLKAVQTDNPT